MPGGERFTVFFDRWTIVLPVALALVMMFSTGGLPGVSTDGAVYLQISRNLLLTHELGWQAAMFLPFHSILTAAVAGVSGLGVLAASALLGKGMFVLLVAAVYLLAREAFGNRTALLASLLTAFFPHFSFISRSLEPEITYSFFLVLSLYLLLLCARRESLLLAGIAGISFAFAYLSRSEGLLVMEATLVVLALFRGRSIIRGRLAVCLALMVSLFFLTISPYLVFLHRHYDAWILHPKATNVMHILNWRIPHDKGGEVAYDDLWRMDAKGRFAWQNPKGGGDVVRLFLAYPRASFGYYFDSLLKQVPGRIPNNSGMEKYPQVIPIYIALLAGVALFVRLSGVRRETKVLVAAPLLVFFVTPLLGGWWKYLVPYVPFLMILAACGIVVIAEKAAAMSGRKLTTPLSLALLFLIVGRFMIAHGYFERPQSVTAPPLQAKSVRQTFNEEVGKAGEYAVRRFGSGRTYMATWSKLVYYLDGLWVPEPITDMPQLLTFARSRKVDYIVKEVVGNAVSIADMQNTPPGIRLTGLYVSPDGTYKVGFYRLENQ